MNTSKIYDTIADRMSKSAMCEFLGISDKEARKVLKADVKALFMERVKDESEFKRAGAAYPEETAITTYQLEDILGCTKTERLRWTKEEKIDVVSYESVRFHGVYADVPNYSRLYVLEHITDEVIDGWRSEYVKEVAKNRKAGRLKAGKTKMKHDAIRQEVLNKHKEDLEEWAKHGEEVRAAMDLAFWTKVVNHNAKTGEDNDWWYAYKEKAIEVLCKFPFTKVEFYRPDKPDLYMKDFHEKASNYKTKGGYKLW